MYLCMYIVPIIIFFFLNSHFLVFCLGTFFSVDTLGVTLTFYFFIFFISLECNQWKGYSQYSHKDSLVWTHTQKLYIKLNHVKWSNLTLHLIFIFLIKKGLFSTQLQTVRILTFV